MQTIRILIADDHCLFRRGIVKILSEQEDFAILGEAVNGEDLLSKVSECPPDLVILDLQMPGKDGRSAMPELRAAAPEVKILVLTLSDSPEDLYRSFHDGASGYLLKDVEPEELTAAIRDLFRGEVPLSPSLVRPFLRMASARKDMRDDATLPETLEAFSLSRRELEVLRWMAEGKTNKEIAKALRISEFTVKNHVKSILIKLQASNRTEAVIRVVRSGVLPERSS